MHDEGPSADDLARFGDEGSQTGFCPECGAEIWDASPSCPSCGAWIEGDVRSRPPEAEAFHRRAMWLGVVIILIAFVIMYVL